LEFLSVDTIIFVVVTFFAILILSLVGFAAALFAMPILALFLDPKMFVPSFTLVTFTTMFALVVNARRHVQWRKVAPMLAGGLLGVPIGAYGLKHLPTDTIRTCISAVVLGFGILLLLKVEIKIRERASVEAGAGFIGGILGGSMATSGPPVVLLGLSRNWPKETFRANLLTFFFCLNMWANCNFAFQGLHTATTVLTYALAVGPAFVGAWLGVLLKNRVSEGLFRHIVLAVILLTGLIGLVSR